MKNAVSARSSLWAFFDWDWYEFVLQKKPKMSKTLQLLQYSTTSIKTNIIIKKNFFTAYLLSGWGVFMLIDKGIYYFRFNAYQPTHSCPRKGLFNLCKFTQYADCNLNLPYHRSQGPFKISQNSHRQLDLDSTQKRVVHCLTFFSSKA